MQHRSSDFKNEQTVIWKTVFPEKLYSLPENWLRRIYAVFFQKYTFLNAYILL
jgi:hypothetical protein